MTATNKSTQTMLRHWMLELAVGGFVWASSQSVMAATTEAPSVKEGFAKVIGGLLYVLPYTIINETVHNPPVVGTAVGLLAGTALACQTTIEGLVEISTAFDPIGSKHR